MGHSRDPILLHDGTSFTSPPECTTMLKSPTGRGSHFDANKYLLEVSSPIVSWLWNEPEGGHFGFLLEQGVRVAPEVAAKTLPELRAGLKRMQAFVREVEAIADPSAGADCAQCATRFYPSRSDARYCSTACRVRAHRAG